MSNIDDNTATPFLSRTATRSRNSRGMNLTYQMPIKSDLTWNTTIILVIIVVMILSKHEITKLPLRLWLVGYIVHCVVHMVCTYIGYKSLIDTSLGMVPDQNNVCNNIATLVELANTIFSIIWWIIGLCWVISGGHILANDAPKLFWLTTIILLVKPILVVFSMAVACCLCIGAAAAISLTSSAEAVQGSHPQAEPLV